MYLLVLTIRKVRSFIGCVLLASLLAGCVIQAPPRPDDPYYAPVVSTTNRPDSAINGSLYRENVAMGLFTDNKAKRIGDIITVILQERTTSSKSTEIEIKKENEVDILSDSSGNGTILGAQPSLDFLGLGTDLSGAREFTGEAASDQSNRLSGNITVTVTDIYPNGTLSIRGEKWITLNRGDEYIRISGLVRPDDVSPENTVESTKIANARITYAGTGEFADSQEMGWLSRFFNSPIWPF